MNRILKLATGYFKCEKSFQLDTSRLEMLVSHIAMMCGIRSVTATKLMKLPADQEVLKSARSFYSLTSDAFVHKTPLRFIDQIGNLCDRSEGQNKFEYILGSFQETENGTLFTEFLASKIPCRRHLEFNVLAEALIVATLFGMSDAHSDNMIISTEESNRIMFFDNSQSFHHSNIAKNRGVTIHSPFRCDLLALSQCYDELKEAELKFIQNELSKYFLLFEMLPGQNKSRLQNYLESNLIGTHQFPQCWINKEALINSFHERLKNVSSAIQKGAIHCLRDIVLAAFPSMKFYALLKLFNPISEMDQNQYITRFCKTHPKIVQSQLFTDLGSEQCLSDIILSCAKGGIDPLFIENLCEKLSFDDTLNYLITYYSRICDVSNQTLYIYHAYEIIFKIRKSTPFDFKDVGRDSVKSLLFDSIVKDCEYLKFPLNACQNDKYYFNVRSCKSDLNLKIKRDGSYHSVEFDYVTYPGKIVCLNSHYKNIFGDKPMTVKEFLRMRPFLDSLCNDSCIIDTLKDFFWKNNPT